MVTYIVVGLLVGLALLPLKFKSLSSTMRYVSWIFVIAVAILIYSIVAPSVFLGSDSWYNQEPYRSIVFYFVMLLGMATSVLTAAIADRRERIGQCNSDEEKAQEKLSLDIYELVYPFLLSFLTFGVLHQQIVEETLSVASMTVAYQTGFFWDAIIKSLRMKSSSSEQA